jgi:hypothetical protein
MLGSGNTLGGSTLTLGGGLGSGVIGSGLGGGFGGGFGGSASHDALTPRGMGAHSSAQHGSGGALASPDSPTSRWAKHAAVALHPLPPPAPAAAAAPSNGGGGGADDAPAADAKGRNG